MINLSFEYGIIMRRERLFQSGMLMYYLIEKFAPQEMVDILDKLMSKRRIEITFNQLERYCLLY